jgi:hypothetical protein
MQCNGHLRTKLPQRRKAKDNQHRQRNMIRSRINTAAPMGHMNNVTQFPKPKSHPIMPHTAGCRLGGMT